MGCVSFMSFLLINMHFLIPKWLLRISLNDLLSTSHENCRLCGGCNRDIGYGNYLGCMGTFFHPECFCCRACRYPIIEHEVNFWLFCWHFPFGFCRSNDGVECFLIGFFFCCFKFSLSGKDAYHKTCFKDLTHPKCEVCFQYVMILSYFSYLLNDNWY